MTQQKRIETEQPGGEQSHHNQGTHRESQSCCAEPTLRRSSRGAELSPTQCKNRCNEGDRYSPVLEVQHPVTGEKTTCTTSGGRSHKLKLTHPGGLAGEPRRATPAELGSSASSQRKNKGSPDAVQEERGRRRVRPEQVGGLTGWYGKQRAKPAQSYHSRSRLQAVRAVPLIRGFLLNLTTLF